MSEEEKQAWRTIYNILVQLGYVEMYEPEIKILTNLFYRIMED